jgi:periplasmic protein CpxP/Spy
MKIPAIAPCLLLAISIGTGMVSAQPSQSQTAPLPSPSPTTTTVPALPKWMQMLQLTPEQVTKVKAVENKSKTPIASQHKKLTQAEAALEALIISGAPESQIREQHSQVQKLRQEFDNARFEAMLKVKDILTKEQRQKLATMNKQRLAKLRNVMQGK